MYILGINGGLRLGYRDASAVLLNDGELVAATEEERFNRVKGAPGQLPEESVRFVLRKGGISMKDVSIVAMHGSTWGDDFELSLKNYLQTNFGAVPKIMRFHHHDCHAASTYYASGFNESVVLTIDNSGDGVSTQFSLGRNGRLELLERISRPNSLGIFYGLITRYCGFRRDEDEFKLMGLASYGKPEIDLSLLLSYGNGSFELNEEYLQPIIPGQSQPTYQQAIFSTKLTDKLGPSRLKGTPITDFYKNVAASAQQLLEDIVLHLVEDLVKKEGIKKVCLAGGVALNCALNRRLMNADFIDNIFVQPAAGDAGISLGAAYLAAHKHGFSLERMAHPYLGEEFSSNEIESSLKQTGVQYVKVDHPAQEAAKLIAKGKVIGWFQGRSEFGPRALGNRSILASPSIEGMRNLVNKKIKFRESFRPFCPSVLEEDAALYFTGGQLPAPFMTINYDVRDDVKNKLNEIVHVDGTARVQTVAKKENPLYHELLSELKVITGFGVCMNTSFNVSHQPIVNTPLQAIMTFYGCGLDALILGDFLLVK